jgi:hypothetical protein
MREPCVGASKLTTKHLCINHEEISNFTGTPTSQICWYHKFTNLYYFQNSANTERTQSCNIPWASSWQLIQIVLKEGKTWSKVLQQLHTMHYFENSTPEKLCKHWNYLHSPQSIIHQPWVPGLYFSCL